MSDRPPRQKVKRGQFVIDPNTLEPVYVTPKGEKIPLRVSEGFFQEKANADSEHRPSETP